MGRRPSMKHKSRQFRKHSTTREDRPFQRFFKIILPSTINDKKLSLPSKFVREYGSELSDVATLTVSSDTHVWKVGLTKGRNYIWYLDKGWDDFARYHSICSGYFLLLKYRGMSSFKVFMFNMTACEIPYSFNEDPPNNVNQFSLHKSNEKEEDDHVEILGSNPYPSTSKRTLPQKNLPRPVNAAADKQKFREEYKRTGKNCKMEEEEEMINNNGKSKAKFETEICISIKFYSTLSRMPPACKNAAEKALRYKPKYPCFLVIMLRCHLRESDMPVPASFANRYMHDVPENITVKSITCDGREWQIQSSSWWRGGCLRLRNGWGEFYNDNDLEEGDVCAFELIQKNNIALKASFFRAYWK